VWYPWRHAMMQRFRVEPYSSYLERRRKGPIYPVTLASGLVFLSGLPPFEPGPVRSNVCRSSAKPRLSLRKCRNVLRLPVHHSRRCLNAMSIARLSQHTSLFSTTFTHAISRASLQLVSYFTCPLFPALSISKSIASRQPSCG
jgi:hypothetical protein